MIRPVFLLALCSFALTACGQAQHEKKVEPNKSGKVVKTEDEWKAQLTDFEYEVLRNKGTERAFTGEYYNHKGKGHYVCKACGHPLFESEHKYDSGSGWPSFYQPATGDAIAEHNDYSHNMVRSEVVCAKCDGHLGHVFEDGPQPTGLRYCINSVSLDFHADDTQPKAKGSTELATFGAGCFWCVEAIFQQLEGVSKVTSGYSGGSVKNPGYREVCTGRTGHAEVVQIEFDPAVISYTQLLEVFFMTHDPTTLNSQGADHGTQYRSAVFFHSDEQQATAESVKQKLNDEQVFPNPIVTEVTKFSEFYKAEENHQDYYNLNSEAPYCRAVILPKLEKFDKVFGELKKAAN